MSRASLVFGGMGSDVRQLRMWGCSPYISIVTFEFAKEETINEYGIEKL